MYIKCRRCGKGIDFIFNRTTKAITPVSSNVSVSCECGTILFMENRFLIDKGAYGYCYGNLDSSYVDEGGCRCDVLREHLFPNGSYDKVMGDVKEWIWNRHNPSHVAFDISAFLGFVFSKPIYAHAVVMGLGFGGNEEGGWWYNYGEVLKRKRVWGYEEIRDIYFKFWDKYGWKNDALHDISDSICGGKFGVLFSGGIVRDWPRGRPSYE